jgi:hypothetical protein
LRAADIPTFAYVDLTGVARLGARLVAVGSDNRSEGPSFVAWTSADGRTWQPVAGTGQFKVSPGAVAATSEAIVATAGDGTVLRSTDGLDWEVVASPALHGWMLDIVGSGADFVGVGAGPAIGEEGSPPPPTEAWTSPDGRTWRLSVLQPSSIGWLQLVVGHGRDYVALGDAGGPTFAYRTTDGQTWTRMASAPDTSREGQVAGGCAGGPCPFRTTVGGLADGPGGPIAVGRTELTSGAYRAVIWALR